HAPLRSLPATDPLDAQHIAHPLDLAPDVVELVEAADLEHQVDQGAAVATGACPGADDVRAGVRHHVGDVGEQPRPVDPVDDHVHGVVGRLHALPGHVDQAGTVFGYQPRQIRAVALVDRHAAAPGDVADDLVTGHRAAAPRQPHKHVVDALDLDRLGRVAAGQGLALELGQLGRLVGAAGASAVKLLE